ncbi:hypothetical protein M407DRAFT_21658 [Tulasnella calospora MUT 4182]|uniref:Zinc/iron permease n=1 Tax=Tulasnella calospora MUT 4182 TaxID=1051891 RepID=A0A0C3M6J1_9AGAM|nr:hypothetical protein M407DRAFT_21658 [Tulasnella calospora MUT 4182]
MALLGLLSVAAFLGISSFIVGMLPLSVSLSQQRLAQFSTLGTGLLLGAAMGVIIPEGIEATYDALPKSTSTSPNAHSHESSPSLRIAMSLLSGFTLMFLIEQVVAPMLLSKESQTQTRATPLPSYARAPAAGNATSPPDSPSTMGGPDLDIELEMELNALGVKTRDEETRRNPRMLTLGLVIHSLADGVALGAANALTATPVSSGNDTTAADGTPAAGSVGDTASGLSVIVFLAIAIHKGESFRPRPH